ncbi:hypothetical protein PVK06_036373 [Gossypium arboreum]|uniref:Plant UBX domain-containing protein 4-like n=1 Tax=Gossypium arboreum TaxID=29729 RepID=A0ABR0NJC1_GOSAR|nr:hypothetical protein PVK06_036373 [Gossypium arboreum]
MQSKLTRLALHHKDPSKNNEVDEIFNQARQLGAVERPIEQLNPSSSSTSFTGTGRLHSGENVSSVPQLPQTVIHNIVFWTDGFTVNDVPLRRLDDPENAHFLELRLADGTRLVAHFNLHNTIGDIISFIDAFRPESATIYQLQMMEFPPKPRVDPTQTVEQAGLINSVVIQKF